MHRAFLLAQSVKNPPAMQVQSLGWEDPLEKEMATRSSILAWKIPWTKGPGGLQSMERPRQGYWSGLPFPTPEDPPDSGIKPTFPELQADSLLLSH